MGHKHTLEKLKFYFYILGGIIFFICVDFLSIKVYSSNDNEHNHNHKKNKKAKKVKSDKDDNKTNNDKKSKDDKK